MMFSPYALRRLVLGLLPPRRRPVYVQYYITARCNLTCKQCNIIYANAATREATTDEVDRIAENLRRIGTAIVLLTGGEPFLRKDLPEIVRSFTRRGIHVRAQTNGLATREQLAAVVDAGCNDISISLDSLLPEKQDFLNGSYPESWLRAIRTIALVTEVFPRRDSFAAFGTVLSPQNFLEIPNLIRFATRIGWYVSLVPAHISPPTEIFNFRSFDREMLFPRESMGLLERTLAECLALKRGGEHLYDSTEYIANVLRFVRGEPIRWRRRNRGRCDSPDLYFAIRPNGDIQPCCDHVLPESFPVQHPDFPAWFRDGRIHRSVDPFTSRCSGCMYGSYPEISITAHFPSTLLERLKVFTLTRNRKPWPLSEQDLLRIVQEVNAAHPVEHAAMARRLERVAAHAHVVGPH